MNSEKQKLTRAFVPVLSIITGILLSYAAIDWRLNANSTNFQTPLWMLLGPLAAAAASVGWVLWPRLTVLWKRSAEGSNENRGYFLLCLVPIVTVGAITWQFDEYLANRAEKLTALSFITEISKKPPVRFYSLNHRYLDRNAIGCDSFVEHHKNSEPIYNFIISCPLLASRADTVGYLPPAWLTFHFAAELQYRKTDEETHTFLDSMSREWRSNFRSAPLEQLIDFQYLERIGSRPSDMPYLQAAERSPGYGRLVLLANMAPIPTVLKATKTSFGYHNDWRLALITVSYGCGLGLFWLVMVAIGSNDGNEADS